MTFAGVSNCVPGVPSKPDEAVAIASLNRAIEVFALINPEIMRFVIMPKVNCPELLMIVAAMF